MDSIFNDFYCRFERTMFAHRDTRTSHYDEEETLYEGDVCTRV